MAELNTSQNFPSVTLVITDARGRPASVQGAPVWASSDDTVISVTPTADGMGAQIDAVAPGTARVTVTADADVGDGVSEITGVTEDITVTQDGESLASSMTLTLGEPTDKVVVSAARRRR